MALNPPLIMADNQTIAVKIKGEGSVTELYSKTGDPITPGFLLKRQTDRDGCSIHNVVFGANTRMFALENKLTGGDIEDDYQENEVVYVRMFRPGDWVLGWLGVGPGNVAGIGDPLYSQGNGMLTVVASGLHDEKVVGRALEERDAEFNSVRIGIEIA
jgi:hypothetical protein